MKFDLPIILFGMTIPIIVAVVVSIIIISEIKDSGKDSRFDLDKSPYTGYCYELVSSSAFLIDCNLYEEFFNESN